MNVGVTGALVMAIGLKLIFSLLLVSPNNPRFGFGVPGCLSAETGYDVAPDDGGGSVFEVGG